MRRATIWFVLLSLMVVAALELRAWFDRHPQDLPWTQLGLADPVGRFTAAKLAALGSSPEQCRSLLSAAGSPDRLAPSRTAGTECGYEDGMRLGQGRAREARFAPGDLVTSCPVASALLLWDERVLQPAARRHFGVAVTAVQHAGSFSCRRLYGRDTGPWSEHATADAVDILGFRLADGRTVSVLRDWRGSAEEQEFLRDVRGGACRLFTTVLSPDYNAAHRDHLHLDTADRGPAGWRACR